MGQGESTPLVYSVQVPGSKKEGSSHIYRNPETLDGLWSGPVGKTSVADVWRQNFAEKPDLGFLGHRPIGKDKDPKTGKLLPEKRFEWETYRSVEVKAKQIGSGIVNLNLAPVKSEFRNYNLRLIAIQAENCPEYIYLDAASCLYNLCTVPIYSTLGEEGVEFMFSQTNLETVFTSCAQISAIVSLIKKGVGCIKNIIVMDSKSLDVKDGERTYRQILNSIDRDEKYQWYTLDQVMKSGEDTPQPYRETGLEDIYTFSYTSGTTGEPKGAMLSHKNILTMVRATSKMASHDGEMRYLSYLPLAHVYERVVMNVVLWRGGKYGIFGGNVFDLKTDLGILQPTVFASVPRLYNRFYDVIKQGMASATGVSKYILDTAIAAKFEKLRSTGSPTHALFDKIVFEKMRQALGGKVQIAITASAPIDASVLEFLKIAFCCPVVEAYGQTEGCGGEFASDRYDSTMGHVGGPSVCNEFKIKSVPEMKYFAEDLDEQGRLLPRGEICVRGSNVIPGYYKNEEKTAETIDEEGWLCSGDIGMILPGSNALKIFDRKKNIFKLAQGEYVAPEKLENALKMCTTVADIYVYGDSLQASLIAVVNCDEKVLTGLATAAGITGTWEEMCVNPEVKKIVADDLAAQSKIAKFKGFEMVRKFEIDPVLFKDHDLLTETHKVKRNEAKIFYKDRLDAMYA